MRHRTQPTRRLRVKRSVRSASSGCPRPRFGFTYVMLKVIDLITPVRVGSEAEEGLDASMHGESAYALGV